MLTVDFSGDILKTKRLGIFNMKEYIKGANPYMPLWEHVPDGEPRVFTYNGEERVYVYGSHDTKKTEYCGVDYVVWSAPTDDLTNWKCHGVCYSAEDGSVLFAPDVVCRNGIYYMYAAEACGSRIMVAKSNTPFGPFTDPIKTDMGFDPGVLVDDDGRVYGYWGFTGSYCAELNDDMATIKEGTLHAHPIGHARSQWNTNMDHYDPEDGFFEASSPRKIGDKYIYIYSKRYDDEVPEIGFVPPCSGFLSYKYSDDPLEGWKSGGDISFNGGEIIEKEDGSHTCTYKWGNNHGSIVEIRGQWYVFYHRQTGKNEFSRQAMLEPIDVAIGNDGKPYIGKILYNESGEPVSSSFVEMTSQGAHTDGLDAYKIISAGYTCHISGASGAYVMPVYDERDDVTAPVNDIVNGNVIGFRYLNFGTETGAKNVTVEAESEADVKISVRIDSHKGDIISEICLKAGEKHGVGEVNAEIIGKHAIYFEFTLPDGKTARFDSFTFDFVK